MKNTPLAAISLAILLWPFSALATSSCDIILQSNRDTLTRCIDELRKEIDRNRLEIQELKNGQRLDFQAALYDCDRATPQQFP